MFDVEALWADFARPIVSADDYLNSVRGRQMNVFFRGERVRGDTGYRRPSSDGESRLAKNGLNWESAGD